MPREAACLEEFPEQSVFPSGCTSRASRRAALPGPRSARRGGATRPALVRRPRCLPAGSCVGLGTATRHTPRRAGCRRGRRGRGGAGPESRFAGATSRDASRNATRLKARATGRCAIGCAPVGKPVQQPDSHGDATCRALVGGVQAGGWDLPIPHR